MEKTSLKFSQKYKLHNKDSKQSKFTPDITTILNPLSHEYIFPWRSNAHRGLTEPYHLQNRTSVDKKKTRPNLIAWPQGVYNTSGSQRVLCDGSHLGRGGGGALTYFSLFINASHD